MIRYGEGGAATGVRLPCGGSIDVLIEYLNASAPARTGIKSMLATIHGQQSCIKQVVLPQAATLLPTEHSTGVPVVWRAGDSLTIRLAAVSHLIIAGVSSVALNCIQLAEMLGFDITVCKHREAEQRQFYNAYSESGRVRLVNMFPARYLEDVGCHAQSAIVSLTHDPRIDDLTLMEALKTPAFYIGAMGYLKNSLRRLQHIGGLTSEQMTGIHAPIGLAKGSITRAEIALSILADIVKYRNQEPHPP